MLADLGKYDEALRAEAAGAFNLRWLVSRLRRPAVAIPTAIAVIALTAFGFWYAQRRADIRWAREVALPEIERLIGENDVWRNLVPPYRLAEQAEAILGDDPELAELFSQVSLDIDVVTEPPGAIVSYRSTRRRTAGGNPWASRLWRGCGYPSGFSAGSWRRRGTRPFWQRPPRGT